MDTETIQGRFKAIIEVEAKEDKELYTERKMHLLEQLEENLKMLADHRAIKDFDLDYDELQTAEGRDHIKMQIEPLQVDARKIVRMLSEV